ncbi:MAG: hypothetical protein E4G91_00170 [Candidatus Zixiibacteriota bacterium]|nr:MAG: hypothetical protein E4G91_00170 [candidate division Zixibacteria bacterium]
MSRVFWFGILACLILSLLACSESTTKPKTESLVYQVGRCQHSAGIAALAEDSCFTATFTKNLLVDLCLVANCCPDTNRFALSTLINSDTILITVADTASSLCDCLCNYKVRAEFQNLPLLQYLVLCSYNDSIIYREIVMREN